MEPRQRFRHCIAGFFPRRPALSPLHWPWLAAIALIVPLQAQALAETPKAADAERAADAAPFRQGVLLGTFGKWEIRKGLIDNTYLLIGESTGDAGGHFWLHCDQNNLITVAVPLAELTGRERLRSHAITIRSDTGVKRAMSLVVFESLVAVAIDYDGGRNDKVADFLDVLRAAKDIVTISYAYRSFDYDVTRLPAARARFQELCNRPPAR
jgi:hypothetical protein